MSLAFTRIVAVGLTVLCVMALTVSCLDSGGDVTTAIERHKRLAGELRDNKLFSAAIGEYEKLLAIRSLDSKQRANVNYLIGKIYYENLADYSQAAAYYIKARAIDPQGSFVNEASKNLVACLEKSGRLVDAKRQLSAAADLDTVPHQAGDVAVAKIGGTSIWLSEIEEQIQLLPPEMQGQFATRSGKIEFAHQYIASELIYRAAIREDYGSDPSIAKQQRLLHKRLLVDKYVVDKVMPQVSIDSLDVRNFYEANKDERYRSQPYDSVKSQVFMDYSNEKAEAAFASYINRLAATDKVEFLDHNIR